MTKFWLEDPSDLFKNLSPIPDSKMNREEKFNALTWFVIYVAIVALLFVYNKSGGGSFGQMKSCQVYYPFMFLISGLLLLALIYFSDKKDDTGGKKEGFSITPTTTSAFVSTTVAPTYAEEWHEPPPEYTVIQEEPVTVPDYTELEPEIYPYSQYVTNINMLPYDQYILKTDTNGTEKEARNFVNDAYTRHDLNFREESMRIYKTSLARRFRSRCADQFSPLQAY